MGEERRLFLFLLITALFVFLMPQVLQQIWPQPAGPEGQPAAPVDKPEEVAEEAKQQVAEVQAEPGEQPDRITKLPQQDDVEVEKEPEHETLVLGSTNPDSGFKMQVFLSNRGAVVREVMLAEYKAEDKRGPLRLLSGGEGEYGSFPLRLKGGPARLARRNWQIVAVPAASEQVQKVRFETSFSGFRLQKSYSLQRNSYRLELTIEIERLDEKPQTIAYHLGGPKGFVLEGVWHARKLRDVVIAGGISGDIDRETIAASTLGKQRVSLLRKYRGILETQGAVRRQYWSESAEAFARFDGNSDGGLSRSELHAAVNFLAGVDEKWVSRPLRFTGVEGQYFTSLLVVPPPPQEALRWDEATYPVLVTPNEEDSRQSDVTVEIESQPFQIAAGQPLQHTYTIYAGPRKPELLQNELGEPALVQEIMLDRGFFVLPRSVVSLTSAILLSMLGFFQKWVGNWGVSIILLTVVVRVMMFPMSRRQAMSAQKMQSLKPELDALREKYKNEKEKLAKAQMELWRKHGVNPLAGCLPVLVQMPIFIGLWYGLSSSVDLRQAPFVLWIDNLAAPDALFHWGNNIPIVSSVLGPYFNLLPTVLIVLMWVQQKLFMPPSADPQMQMQQKMMTYMMLFFGFIFYRFPSGLCLYYTASTTWGIAERKLLPKFQHEQAPAMSEQKAKKTQKARSPWKLAPGGDRRGTGRDGKAMRRERKQARGTGGKKPGWSELLNDLLKKARKP